MSFAWDPFGDGRTSVRGGYGLYFNTNNHQNLIVTVTNPPATPRVSIANPTFPVPPFERGLGNTIRPIQYDLDNPRIHVWNLNLQRELCGPHRGDARLRGLARPAPAAQRRRQRADARRSATDGTLFFPAGAPRPNTAFATIEQKTSDGDSWYNALLVRGARGARPAGLGFQSSLHVLAQHRHHAGLDLLLRRHQRHHLRLPGAVRLDYNKGLADYHAKHNWVFNVTWDIPLGPRGRPRAARCSATGRWR